MAQEVITRLIDDIDGNEAVETIEFGVDGHSYVIDLNEKNAAAFRKALDKYVGHARENKAWPTAVAPARKRKSSGAAARDVDPRAVRVWAAENGVEVNSKGRVPAPVIDAYLAAVNQ